MEELIIYITVFILVYLGYFVLVISRDKKSKEFKKSSEVVYLSTKYKLDLNKINMKKLNHVLALTNSFIIANVALIVGLVDGYVMQILVGFVLALPMIIGCYHLIGKYFQKGGLKK